ncbi:MAG TPA: hypothetical protein VKN74_06865 [Candidatus Mcinerneyibacterium sp.]|nr:hypothetical protein [Candidatus Mcinerneyibacterium sp.]
MNFKNYKILLLLFLLMVLFSCRFKDNVVENIKIKTLEKLKTDVNDRVYFSSSKKRIGKVVFVSDKDTKKIVLIELKKTISIRISSIFKDNNGIRIIPSKAKGEQYNYILLFVKKEEQNNVENKNIFPKRIDRYIKEDTVFLMAEIGQSDVNYLGNRMYILNEQKEIYRLENKSLPENNKYFNSKPELFYEIDKNKYKEFLHYINNLQSNKSIKNYMKTPGNLHVYDGTNLYIYLKTGNGVSYYFFEPGVKFRKNIKNRFNKLFE